MRSVSKISVALLISISISFCKQKAAVSKQTVEDDSIQILKGHYITAIGFDGAGNAWLGSFQKGLIRYSPSETTLFTAANSPLEDSLLINAIVCDVQNHVWIGTSAGLYRYDGHSFTRFHSGNGALPIDLVSALAKDSKGNLWIASGRHKEGGIVRYDGKQWRVFTPENSNLPAQICSGITVDNNDNVWFALNNSVNENYLVKMAGNQMKVYTKAEFGHTPYYLGNIHADRSGNIWVKIDYSLSSSWEPKRDQLFRFDGLKSVRYSDSLLQASGRYLGIDASDRIWCGSAKGIVILENEKWEFSKINAFGGTGLIVAAPDQRMWCAGVDGVEIR